MKILKIRFENIHSLKGEHEVDFADGPLAEAGLFAITGPTGSGKSTLLDVITLALYNRIARVNKSVSNTILEDDGGIMTRNMKSCYAEVEYQVNGKKYRSHWSIERNRNNNLNQRKQELVEVATGNILESTTKTPDKNAEIIGLSYDQFVKAMVLSQGEFSKLLQAPRNERNKLLEDITGARSYREIGRAVFQRYRKVQKDIELKEANLEGMELLSSEAIKAMNSELKSLNESKPKIEKELQKASEKVSIRKELQAKENDWKVLENEKVNFQKDLDQFIPFKKELDIHERLSKYSSNLRDFETAIKELISLTDQSKQLQLSKTEAEKQQSFYLKNTSDLIKENVGTENANSKLEDFRNKIVNLQAEERKKFDEARLFKDQLNSHIQNIRQLDYDLAKAENPEHFELKLESFKETIKESIANSGMHSMEELNSALENNRSKYEKAMELLTKKEQTLKLQSNLENQKAKLKTVAESISEDSNKTEILTSEIQSLEKVTEQLAKTLENQRKHQSLEQYRQQLEPETPCPLCGSLEHPYALEEPYFDSQEELLKEKRDSLKTKSELVAALNGKNKYQSESLTGLKKEILSLTNEVTEKKNQLISIAKEIKWNHEDSLESLDENRNQLKNSIDNLEKSKRAFQTKVILKDAEISFKHWKNSETIYSYTKKERIALYEGNDINEKSNALTSKITHSIAQLSSLETQLHQNRKKIEIATPEKEKLNKELSSILTKESLQSIEELRDGIMKEERASKIRKQKNTLNERKTRLSEKESSLQKTIKELKEKDESEITFETLTLLLEQAKKSSDDQLLNIGRINQSLEKDQKDRARQQKVLDEVKLLKKDLALWKSMNDLIGDATGNKFSNFVQDLTLEQLILFANQRLAEFSDRYILDIPTADEVDKSDTLKIFDKYMGNARRSVRTLSGGETFLVSLAMAFALSDIAAKNVKIESLFIDEGFGTLDPETLDQAITILEKMQNEGDKSVGIISHVSSLKERITTQIKLDKGSLGYSTLEVVQ